MFDQNMPTLNDVFQTWPSPSDQGISHLPIAHLTSLRSFRTTMSNTESELQPKHCNVFGRKLLYFSYGGIFHRYKKSPTDDIDWLPVALLFEPELLEEIDWFFPYDTGGAHKRLYGDFNDDLIQFDTYRISINSSCNLPSKFIHNVYNGNEQYLQGTASIEEKEIFQIEPVATLVQFLRKNLTDDDVDHRQRAIECLTLRPISLENVFNRKQILWVGLPESERGLGRLYSKLCTLSTTPRPIHNKYYYKYRRGQNPDEIAAILENEARKIVENYLDLEQQV
jgi:hypothetical protein